MSKLLRWKRFGYEGRHLKKGDILRCKVGNKEHPQFGNYVYGICSGGGFGCNPNSMGNAIFMDFYDFDFATVYKEAHKKRGRPKKKFSRWEAFWGIEYLEEWDIK